MIKIDNFMNMSISWSFSYNFFVKIHGKNVQRIKHDLVISKSGFIMCVIKGLQCTMLLTLYRSIESDCKVSFNIFYFRKRIVQS